MNEAKKAVCEFKDIDWTNTRRLSWNIHLLLESEDGWLTSLAMKVPPVIKTFSARENMPWLFPESKVAGFPEELERLFNEVHR